MVSTGEWTSSCKDCIFNHIVTTQLANFGHRNLFSQINSNKIETHKRFNRMFLIGQYKTKCNFSRKFLFFKSHALLVLYKKQWKKWRGLSFCWLSWILPARIYAWSSCLIFVMLVAWKRGLSLKNCILSCIVLSKSVLFNLLCVLVFFENAGSQVGRRFFKSNK